MTSNLKSCKARVAKELAARIADLRTLWAMYSRDPDSDDEVLGNIHEYGLSFDYVPASTFEEQKEGYFRYQLSWGGPSDEFRIFVNPDLSPHRIEYWFMDWFDGARLVLDGEKEKLLEEIYGGLFLESGTAQVQYEAAREGF